MGPWPSGSVGWSVILCTQNGAGTTPSQGAYVRQLVGISLSSPPFFSKINTYVLGEDFSKEESLGLLNNFSMNYVVWDNVAEIINFKCGIVYFAFVRNLGEGFKDKVMISVTYFSNGS